MEGWEKTGKNTWLSKLREIRLKIVKGHGKNEYPYGVEIESTYTVAGGRRYLKGFTNKYDAVKFAMKWMGEREK
jgi:hypothetical protein